MTAIDVCIISNYNEVPLQSTANGSGVQKAPK